MNNPTVFSESIHRAFRPTPRAVVGLVDDLLALCREQELELDWHADHCRVRTVSVSAEETVEVPLSKSVFRAVLARLAALCNEHRPESVSPYGGEGELTIGTSPPMVCRVVFTNTPTEQRVQLTRATAEPPNGETQQANNGELLGFTESEDTILKLKGR